MKKYRKVDKNNKSSSIIHTKGLNYNVNKDLFIPYDNKTVRLLKIQTNQIKNVTYDKVIDGLYYQKYKIPDNISSKEKKELKETISRINYHIPLYDPYSDNLYLITSEDLYNCIFVLYNVLIYVSNNISLSKLFKNSIIKLYLYIVSSIISF